MLAQSGDWIGLFTGPFALLLFLLTVIWTGIRRFWVFGWQFEDMRVDRDRYRDMALRGVGAAEKSVEVTQELAERKSGHDADVAELIAEAKRRGLLR